MNTIELEELLIEIWDKGFQAHRTCLVPKNRIDEREFRQMAIDAALPTIQSYINQAEKKTASKIFDLAHEYALNDETMRGAEELKAGHYYAAIAKIGEFDGR